MYIPKFVREKLIKILTKSLTILPLLKISRPAMDININIHLTVIKCNISNK